MFDDYKVGQPLVYDFLINSIKNNKISHAYLFDVSGLNNKDKFAIAFAKLLICPNFFSNIIDKCNNCNLCNRIDNGNYTEIKIVEPDGLWIRKEQVMELQQAFATKAVEGKYKIYIIKDSERLNKHAANSILKFLEEPADNIIAILLTNNIYQMLPTILSRCQIITLAKELTDDRLDEYKKQFGMAKAKLLSYLSYNFKNNNNNLNIDNYVNMIDIAIKFIIKLEENKHYGLLVSKKMWHDYFIDKDHILFGLDAIILFYRDVINDICNREIEFFNEYHKDIKNIAKLNDIMQVIDKIKIIVDMKEKINNNINNQLLIDKLIIEIAEV